MNALKTLSYCFHIFQEFYPKYNINNFFNELQYNRYTRDFINCWLDFGQTIQLYSHVASNKDPNIAIHDIQYDLNQISNWTKKWKIKINENKSVQINFSRSRNECPQLSLNNVPIPIQNVTKYLGVYLDKRLIKRTPSPPLFITVSFNEFKKQNITPLWSYGIQIWGQAKPSNIRPIQALFQSIIYMSQTNNRIPLVYDQRRIT